MSRKVYCSSVLFLLLFNFLIYKANGTIFLVNTHDIQTFKLLSIIIFATCTFAFAITVYHRHLFKKNYGLCSLSWDFRITLCKQSALQNTYTLDYPYWAFSKKDGTADLRHKNNSICWKNCFLYIDNFLVISNRPYQIIRLVETLRNQGAYITPCQEESQKIDALTKQYNAFSTNSSLRDIVDFYSDNPTRFEALCADLFQKMGYSAQVTPPTNDGGYDIVLTKDSSKTIVECKCYSVGHHIGRPTIQKLVGANSIAHADHMLFVTTSNYSSGAIEYAASSGVSLINGSELLKLLSTYGFLHKNDVTIAPSEWQLTVSDLKPYVPTDIYSRFFL